MATYWTGQSVLKAGILMIGLRETKELSVRFPSLSQKLHSQSDAQKTISSGLAHD